MSIVRPFAVRSFVALSVMAAAASSAVGVTHSILLEAGATVPGSDFVLAPLEGAESLQINNAGAFAFTIETQASEDGTSDRDEGVIRGNVASPSALTLAGRTGQTFDGLTFDGLNQQIVLNNAGSLLWAFDVDYNTVPANNYGETIVYNGNVIAKYGDTIDGYSYNGSLSESLSLSQGGKVAHFLHLFTPADADSNYPYHEQQVLIVNGQAIKRGGDPDPALSTLAGQPFHGFGQSERVAANDAGKIVVTAWVSQVFDMGLFVIDGNTETMLARNGAPYDGAGPYNGWTTYVAEEFALNEAGDVVYRLFLEDPNDPNNNASLILKNGTVIAESNSGTIGGQAVTDVGSSSLNEAGQVAYEYYFPLNGDEYGGHGISIDGTAVAYTGMIIDGREVEDFESSFDLNDNGQLLYVANFTDGTSALIVTVIPEPASLSLLAGAVAMGMGRRRGGR